MILCLLLGHKPLIGAQKEIMSMRLVFTNSKKEFGCLMLCTRCNLVWFDQKHKKENYLKVVKTNVTYQADK